MTFLLSMVVALMLMAPQWNFETDPIGSVPRNWEARGGSPEGVYRVEADSNRNHFLAARSNGSDVQLGVSLKPSHEPMPILSWRWRVWELPSKADERAIKTMDSAAAVYAVFGSRLFPRVLKYVWSTSVPAGASFRHPVSGRMVIIVIASGTSHLGEWQVVSRNIFDDYRAAFRSDPGNLIAIGIKTDSDSTGTSAHADYDDLRLERLN
jgi:ribosomal protein RSM22 (predicted rRNA methylase)